MSFLQTHANHHHVDRTANAEFQMVKAYARVYRIIEDHRRIAGLSVL